MSRSRLVPAALAAQPWMAIFLTLALGACGTLMLYSAASGNLSPWAFSHGIRFTFFFCVAIALSRVPLEWLRQGAFPVYGGIFVLIIGVTLFGSIAGGARSWLDLGFMRLQPSELMKPALILALARFYDLLPPAEVRRLGGIWPAALMIVIPTALIFIQPDLGTAITLLAGGAVAMFLAGVPLRLFAIGGLGAAVAIPLFVNFGMHEYQRNRILIFLDPEADPLGAGYHITQSKIAIGSGGLTGKGFLNSSQVHLDYLPEGHTDFVFALIAEEFGLIGGLLVILAFVLLTLWGIGVSLRAKTRFERLAAAGLSATIFIYVAVNLLMAMGLAPVTGIPLPLISHGGSSMMTVMICIGMLFALDRATRRPERW